jgi:hypothetical protein
MFLHLIPELSDRFMYANDDMFPLSPLSQEDLFTRDGRPCMHVWEEPAPRCPNIFERKCIFQQNVVRGITTAAGLWVTAAIGLACGAGLYVEAVFATVAVLLVLELMHAVLPSAGDNVLHVTLSSDDRERLAGAVEALRNEVLDIESCRISFGDGLYRAALDVHVRNRDRIEGILQLLRGIEGVGLDAIE